MAMSNSDTKMLRRVPLIIILGATGSGKTKLSLTIAQKYGGEILSADSMQVYTGLDILTAKATPEERSVAPHHLIDIIHPLKEFTVYDFRNRAVKIIDDVITRNKLPIVVGGTNYYIESLLFKILVENPDVDETLLCDRDKLETKKLRLTTGISSSVLCAKDDTGLTNEELHQKLTELDPEIAKQLHPNNRRKILRALQVVAQRGQTLSEILREQRAEDGGTALGGPLRYPHSLILWLQCEQDVLDQRLNDRVDSMVEQGLLKELTDFHQQYNEDRIKDGTPPDYTKGIFQSIGFKEFHEYLMLGFESRETDEGKKLFKKGLEDLKMVTRRYAKKQNRRVTNRYLGYPDRQVPPVYSLDTTDISKWRTNVEIPALEIIESYLNNTTCKYSPLPKKSTQSCKPVANATTHRCEICDRIFIGDFQWSIHINSNKHKRALKKKQKESTISATEVKQLDASTESASEKQIVHTSFIASDEKQNRDS